MDLTLNGERIRVNDSDLLGQGGEACVYRYRDLALKVFHPLKNPSATEQKARDEKLKKLEHFPPGLPAQVIAPRALLRDRSQRVAGYAMQAIDKALDFSVLSSRKWREGTLSNAALLELFRTLASTLDQVHTRSVVVGDLNDGNVLFRAGETFLIDADSMQFGNFSCAVGHERFLDPLLYGVDLTGAPRFDEGTDWYAFAVLLFSSLLYVHPYGGVSKQFPTLLRRAEARHSVLRSEVAYPRHAVHYRVLPDDLLHYFENVFEKNLRQRLDDTLMQLMWTRCSCGLEHARAVCPDCHTLGPAAMRPVIRHQGRCTARSVFRTSGRIVCAAMQGGLRYLYEEGAGLRREDGTLVGAAAAAGQAWAISGAATYVAEASGSLKRFERGRCVEHLTTGLGFGRPVLAAASTAAFHAESAYLVNSLTGARVGQLLEGQTQIWVGPRFGFGFWRAGELMRGFTFDLARSGLREMTLPVLRGRLVEARAFFDEGHVLFSLAAEADGQRRSYLYLYDASAKLIASAEGTHERMFTSQGRALLNGKVVCATDEGLLSLKVDSGKLIEAALFEDSEPFISAADELYSQPDGSLYVVGAKEITQLSLK